MQVSSPNLPAYMNTLQAPAPPQAPAKPPGRRARLWVAALLVILALLVITSTLAFLIQNQFGQSNVNVGPAPIPIVGHAFFVGSGQSQDNSQFGIADRLQIDLSAIPEPTVGKSYYMWLLPDTDSNIGISPIMVGSFSHGGVVNVAFPGDTLHHDLLASYSRFLITEEDAAATPSNP
jgi:hypothetical protein